MKTDLLFWFKDSISNTTHSITEWEDPQFIPNIGDIVVLDVFELNSSIWKPSFRRTYVVTGRLINSNGCGVEIFVE